MSKKVSNGDSKYFELKTFSYKPRTHTAADHDFSDAKRIVHDTRQSLKVAEAMDEEFGRTYMPESIAMLLREPEVCLLYTSPSPRDLSTSRMPSSA